MKILKKILNNENGSEALAGVITAIMVLTIFMSFVYGGFSYFWNATENNNLNFQVGRYASTLDSCSVADINSLSYLPQFSDYKIEATIDGGYNLINSPSTPQGTIQITCSSADWQKGAVFGVSTLKNASVIQIIDIFPTVSAKGAFYVVE